jgi:hypothetical protein
MTVSAVKTIELSNFGKTNVLELESQLVKQRDVKKSCSLLSKIHTFFLYCISGSEPITFQIKKSMKTIAKKMASQTSLTSSEKEQIVDQELLEISKVILEKQKSHIIIRVYDAGGFGDLLFALKLTDTLFKQLPNVKIALVFTDPKTIEKTKAVAKEYPYIDICYTIESLPEEFRNPKGGICIGAAAFYGKTRCGLDFDQLKLPENYPFLYLPEYGDRNNQEKYYENIKVTGLQRHQYGIFIEKRLTEIVESNRNPSIHISKLTDASLKKRILEGQTPTNYAFKTNLYFGYGHSTTSHTHFIRSVAHFEKTNSSKNIDLILILDNPDELKLTFEKKIIEELALQGFGLIEIVSTSTGESQKIELSKKSNRILRIITKKNLSHDDFLTCLLMSQPLTLASGDQSLSEGISANKIFIYELYEHKLLFEQSLIDLADALHLPLVKAFLEKSRITERDFFEASGGSVWSFPYMESYNQNSSRYDELANQFLLNQQFITQWKSFIIHVQKKKSFNEKVASLVGRRLAASYYPLLLDDPVKNTP